LDYYQELLDEPDRMVAVFDTMKPVRDEQNKITGYVVGLEGEKDFFDAVGLQQGDIVRSVNSVAMTHRRRAESFIDQFLKDKLNVLVMEVERGGKVTKQVYQLRP
jgi:type II secretory pathway component PulC